MKNCEVLKIFRIINDMKGIEVSEKSGMKKSTISIIESGRYNPNVATIKKLAKVYNVEYAQIMYICNGSRTNNWNYYQTMKNALLEWFKNNGGKTEMDEDIKNIERFQMGKVLKAARIINQQNYTDVRTEAFVTVNRIESGDVALTFDTLIILAKTYGIPASKLLDVQEKSVKGKWNFQKILYEVLVSLEYKKI